MLCINKNMRLNIIYISRESAILLVSNSGLNYKAKTV